MSGKPSELAPLRPRLEPSSTALIICDMQNDFVHLEGAFAKHSGRAPSGNAIIPVIRTALDASRRRGLPVFYTKVVNRRDGVGQSLRVSRLIGAVFEGTWGSEIVVELQNREKDFVIEKWRYSGFYATPLETLLRGREVKHVVLCGATTSGAVDSTVRDAEYRDFNVVVLGDGCADSSPELHEASLERIRLSFGTVMTTDWFIDLIGGE